MWKPTPSAPGFPSGRVVRLYGAVRSDVKVGTFAAIIGTSQGQCELSTNIWGTDLPRADLDVERRAIKLGHSVLLFDAIAIRLSACWHLDLERGPGCSPAGTCTCTIWPDGAWTCTIWPGKTPSGTVTCIMDCDRNAAQACGTADGMRTE